MLKIIIIFLLLFWILGSLWWYISPPSMLNISYKSNLNLKELKEPHLIIASHYYKTVDAMLICNESKYPQKTINIVAEFKLDKPGDIFNQFWKSFPLYTSYRKLNLHSGKKNNLVEKSKKILNEGEHVLIFLDKRSNSKGIYHILKESKVPILMTKIYREDQDLKFERKDNNYINTFYGKNFKIDYEVVRDYPIEKNPEDFMKWVKDNLYN